MPHETEPTVQRVRLTSFTTDDIDRRPVYASDRPGSPVATILAMKDEDATRDTDPPSRRPTRRQCGLR